MRNGWAGIRGRPPGRAAPGSRPAHGAPASASAARTRTRPARGEGRAPGWPGARGWRWRSWRWRSWRWRSWRSRSWRCRGWRCRGWRCRGWRAAVGVSAGTIPREALRRARNRRHRLTRRQLAHLQLAPGLACPGHRQPLAGADPEPSGPAARTRRAPDFSDHPSGTGLYAAAPPLTRNHDDDSRSTGHFLYSSQTPVRAHFRQKALVCRSSHFLVHTGWPAV
jgi:hypothetical protein